MDKKKRTNEWGRHRVQILWAFLTNSYLVGFVKGKIYQGKLKNLCVPGLNCYSCPGALGACPIGAMQAVVGSWNFKLAFYVAGFLMFVGALLGRFVCGWLCPFGLIQDLLHKIPFPKKISTFRGDRLLRKLKYVIFLVFCDPDAHVCGGSSGAGGAVFLQADLSGRNSGGRRSSGAS